MNMDKRIKALVVLATAVVGVGRLGGEELRTSEELLVNVETVMTQENESARANLAVVAKVTTSYVSGHEHLSAINDGLLPERSNDNSHGAYGNWPMKGTQWVGYEWPKEVVVDQVEVFWYDDGRGVRLPRAARVKYWTGTDWAVVQGSEGLGLEKDKLNVVKFPAVKTTKLRLEMEGEGDSSTGAMEWVVRDEGSSPDFPPVVNAGVDRILVMGGRTYLKGSKRETGKKGVKTELKWEKASGPGEVKFEKVGSIETSATFSAPGVYELKLVGSASGLSSEDVVRVRVDPVRAVADLHPIQTKKYALDSTLWNARAKALITKWIPHCVAENDKPDLKEGGMNNIIEAGKRLRGEPSKAHIGYPFSNAWVLNTVEAMCVAQMVDAQGDAEIEAAQKAMRDKLEEWIPLLLAAQEPDGYFQTRFTLGSARDRQTNRKAERWDPRFRTEHEGYVAGYFIEAGVAHYLATEGKDLRLYNAAKKLADCWYDNVGPAPKKPWYDGHQAMEIALFRLAGLVDEVEGAGKGAKYAELAKYLLDARATTGKSEGEYDQTHVPVTHQYAAVGHAVRAVYNYTAMADVAKRAGDTDYQSAVRSLWDNLVNRKYYVTGGVGSGETSEGFGADYSLPNNAYCESCSGAGMLFFQQRMNVLDGSAKYADIYEETLFNAILSDIDLAGENFTYTNALDTEEKRYKWHVCPCCVGNIPRTLLMLPTWTYAAGPSGLNVNLFIGSTMTVDGVAGTKVKVKQETNYPWDGKVVMTLEPEAEKTFELRVRMPDRSVSEIYTSVPEANGLTGLMVNGEAARYETADGYAVIRRTWRKGDKVSFELPMAIQRVRAIEQVAATRGRVAIKRGPIVFNFEAVDQTLGGVLPPDAELKAQWEPDLLGGVMTIRGKWADGSPLLGIPNYARNNRGGRSMVWLRER